MKTSIILICAIAAISNAARIPGPFSREKVKTFEANFILNSRNKIIFSFFQRSLKCGIVKELETVLEPGLQIQFNQTCAPIFNIYEVLCTTGEASVSFFVILKI